MTENEIKRRNERLTPTTVALAHYDQWLSRAEYEECCSLAGIEPRADNEIRRDEYGIRGYPYTPSEDPTLPRRTRQAISKPAAGSTARA